MHALVTGAGGFLGLYIVEQLIARKERVRAFCRGAYPALDRLGVETVRGDIRDRAAIGAACEGIDCVFHVAAVPGIWGRWEHFRSINTQGTENVLESCKEHGVAQLVFTSSPSVTFDGRSQEGINESASYPREGKWLAHYPHSKAIAEQAVVAANGERGLATTALRPHLIWGPRDSHLIPRLIARARSGRLRRVGDGTNLVDMIYVENAAMAHLAAADALTSPEAPPAGKAYFVSQGEPVNCWKWINDILALADLPPIEKSISVKTASRVGAICEHVWRLFRLSGEPPMTRFLAAQLGTSHWFDISAARRDFGFSPKISTEEGMSRLSDWVKAGPVRASSFAT